VEYNISPDKELNVAEANDLIPAHSHVMEAWVDAGILGPLFWIYALILSCKGLVRAILLKTTLTPIYVFTLIEFIWALLFSPSGGITILQDTFLIIVLGDLLSWMPETNPKPEVRSRRGLRFSPIHSRGSRIPALSGSRVHGRMRP
jgi:hypothetical protein